jgi:hypothetical protein
LCDGWTYSEISYSSDGAKKYITGPDGFKYWMTYAGNVDWTVYTWKGIGDINNGYTNTTN